VEVEDTLLNLPLKIKADMVVLSMAMTPSSGTKNLAEILGIEVGNSGFLEEIYPKLKPVETKAKGIYICGCAHGPKDIPESVTQAEAAAFKVVLDLSQEKIGKDMDIAYIDEKTCDACKVCVDVCPFDAIEMVDITKEGKPSSVARIEEIKCNRCGSCASRCPTGAVQLRRYNDELVLSQLSQLLSKKNGSMSPKIVAFCCDECGYATVDLAGMSHEAYSANVLPIRVPCLGWVSLYQIFKALETGADGVLLVGCMIETCQNLKGAVYAEKTVAFAKEILDEIGLNGKRIKLVPVCAADATKFIAAAESLISDVKGLKPIKTKIGGAKNG
jgi:heterodisulfide reductase subunit A